MAGKVFYTTEMVEEFLRGEKINFDSVISLFNGSKDFEVKIGKKVVKKLLVDNSSFYVYDYSYEQHRQTLVKVLDKQWIVFVKNSLDSKGQLEYYDCLRASIDSKLVSENYEYTSEKAYFLKKIEDRRKAHNRVVQVCAEEIGFLNNEFNIGTKARTIISESVKEINK